jgi:hypothetical protein
MHYSYTGCSVEDKDGRKAVAERARRGMEPFAGKGFAEALLQTADLLDEFGNIGVDPGSKGTL